MQIHNLGLPNLIEEPEAAQSIDLLSSFRLLQKCVFEALVIEMWHSIKLYLHRNVTKTMRRHNITRGE
jgi:hypothetical protein